MNLPRVVVDVAPGGPGWTVAVAGAGVAAEFPVHRATVEAGGREFDVPHRGDCADLDGFTKLLVRIENRDLRDGDVREYGKWLFGCLLEPVWADVRKAPAVVAARGVELALRWPIGEAPLHQLTWEAMYHDDIPLANDPELLVAITRLVPVATGPVRTVERTPRVLFAVGGALLDDTIRPGAMFMGLLRALDADGVCAAKAVQSVTSDDLRRHCTEFRPDVVHLVAHGDVVEGRGRLKLGKGDWATADVLVSALTEESRPLAVVLSACRTGSGGAAEPMSSGPLAAELVARGIPIVSAVAGEVSEQACRLYSRRLVEAISDGTPLAKAVAQGRRAALSESDPGERLDWAMPALFVSESVEPAFRPVNRDSAEWLVKAARQLRLRQSPVFIGRAAILESVDRMFAGRKPLGVIGALRHGSLAELGGTRLLQEMGYQLLLRGHVPLMLGPFSPAGQPADFRGFVAEVFKVVVEVAEHLRLELPAFESFQDLYPPGRPAGAREARRALMIGLDRFERATDRLNPLLAKDSLAHDLGVLARTAAGLGTPFGPHTRVVLLADELHQWPFAADLKPILEDAGENGLGTGEQRVPFVFTASSQEHWGPLFKSLSDLKDGQDGYAFPPLAELEIEEAMLGFQWVLLNPWLTGDEKCRKVYAALPGADWEFVRECFALLEGKPSKVRDPLFYKIANVLVKGRSFVADDDFAAWNRYLGLPT